ncbi:uncharacterized protein LOC143221871 [Lasioglossum baleicum]|uniref:uncharacterized protein LOC143221871 n=1 Tax=Lasioglossum baleicum TaxID=434251 RepID=UPI003FCE1F16
MKVSEQRLFQIHRFNGHNYQLWRRQMEIFMTENKLKPYILGSVQRTTENSKLYDEKDAEAQAFLMRGLELEQLKFINATMEENEKMADFIARIVSLTQRLKDMDLEQKEPVIIAKILSGLSPQFDNVRTAWYAVPKRDQTVDRLTDHLVNEEAILCSRSKEETSVETALLRNTGNSQKRPGKCNYCKIPGHWARECRKKARDYPDTQNQRSFMAQGPVKNERYSVGFDGNSNNDPFLLTAECSKEHHNVWFADSGATHHMSFQNDWFKNFESYPEKSCCVKVGNGEKIDARGKGDVDVQIQGDDGIVRTHTIKDVLYVPQIEKNLLSVYQTTMRGTKVTFEEGGNTMRLERNGKTIITGVRDGNLYKLKVSPARIIQANLAACNSPMMWHERLGHRKIHFVKVVFLENNTQEVSRKIKRDDHKSLVNYFMQMFAER